MSERKPKIKKKNFLNDGVEKSMLLPTEKERMYAVIDLIRGYKNEYHPLNEKDKNEGFERCKTDLVIIREKIKAKLDEIFDKNIVSLETNSLQSAIEKPKYEKRYFIYIHEVSRCRYDFNIIKDQPRYGFDTEEKAEEHLASLLTNGDVEMFPDNEHIKYVIMKTFFKK